MLFIQKKKVSASLLGGDSKMFSAKGRGVWWGQLRFGFSNNSCLVIMVQ